MSSIETLLLCAMFAGSLLIEVRLPAIGVSAATLCVPLSAAALAWMRRDALREAFERYRPLLGAALAVYAWMWISAIGGFDPALSIRYVVKYTNYFVAFAALLVFLDRRPTTEAAQPVAYGFLVVLGVFGVVEYWQPQASFFTFFRRQPTAHPRVVSLMIWPNQFAVLMAIAIGWGATLLNRRKISPLSFYAATPFLGFTLALSGSRSGWLVFIVLFAVLALARVVSLRQAAAASAVFALALITFSIPRAQLGLTGVATLPIEGLITMHSVEPGGTDPSTEARPPRGTGPPRETLLKRVQLWRAAIVEIERHPVSGIGLEVFANHIGPRIVPEYWINTHNLFLNVAVELGLVGAGLAAAFVYVLLRTGNRRDWTTTIPLLGVVVGQLFDCFTYDHTFMTCALFFAASYASLPPQSVSVETRSPQPSYPS